MINRISLSIAAILVIALVGSACSSGGIGYQTVRFISKTGDSVDFKQYKTIYFPGFTLENPQKDYNPREYIKKFMLGDFAKAIEVSIESLQLDTDYFADQAGFLAAVKRYTSTLILTGKLTIKVSDRTVVDDLPGRGKKEKARFKKLQNWQIDAHFYFIEADSGKVVLDRKFSDKRSDMEADNPAFSFEGIFYRVTDRFLNQLQRGGKPQQRYLIKK